ncbi:MAG: hypothetical protein IPN65_01905 [Elusimicrobia bacterium]|nr:hypothetical protein [Elusimicrobiota bacterium]MBK8126380.1 hypothetical protein [Elusimicrobiota bacterium]MBK9056398.1 hypothetical protein [Elusimicrobiota bacterium]MBK9429260.1 hypothetical protein [Elusimicrobiota bacterium]MBK9923183.1 hypothetical protein [Elusimicrobiota bacterium]
MKPPSGEERPNGESSLGLSLVRAESSDSVRVVVPGRNPTLKAVEFFLFPALRAAVAESNTIGLLPSSGRAESPSRPVVLPASTSGAGPSTTKSTPMLFFE